MTDADLQQIEARADAATKGPWDVDWECTDDGYECPTRIVANREGSGGADVVIGIDDWDDGHQIEPDAKFIAHARTDIPTLVAEVRRLRALCGEAAEYVWCSGTCAGCPRCKMARLLRDAGGGT